MDSVTKAEKLMATGMQPKQIIIFLIDCLRVKESQLDLVDLERKVRTMQEKHSTMRKEAMAFTQRMQETAEELAKSLDCKVVLGNTITIGG